MEKILLGNLIDEISLIDELNDKKSNLITLYPFNGSSPFLIDKFYIIGYNYLTLEKLLITEKSNHLYNIIKSEF